MRRQAIVKFALNAYTLEECASAERELRAWLHAHPDDVSLHEIAGILGIVKVAAQEAAVDVKKEGTCSEAAIHSQEQLETLLLEGLHSGPPVEATAEYWQQREAKLLART